MKLALSSETVLAHYNPSLPVELSVDASPYGLGAVIMHVYPNGTRRPIAYASRTLNEHEKRYGQIDKETWAGAVSFIPVWSTLYNSDGPQASRANLWPQDSHPFLGSHASTALGYHSVSL